MQCWCEDDIPPWSVFWVKSLLEYSPLKAPVAIVTRPGLPAASDGRDKEDAINDLDLDLVLPTASYAHGEGGPNYGHTLYLSNFYNSILTNGGASIPAFSVFEGIPLLTGVHWLGYDADKSDPTHKFFFPRDDTWYLGSMINSSTGNELEGYGQDASVIEHRIAGVTFKRIGLADEVNRCVPVIMCALPMDNAQP